MHAGALGLILASGALMPDGPVFAAEPMPANFVRPEKRNAAIRYLVAVTLINPEAGEKLRSLDWNTFGDNVDPAKMPEAFKEVAKLDFAPVIARIEDGSRMSHCNFESNYEAGIMTNLPYLGHMRQLARILRFDARRQLTLGNADAAADRLITILRFSNHLKSDGWLINALVGVAVDGLAFAELPVVAAAPSLSAAKRAELETELRKNDIPDPLHFGMALKTERLSIAGALKRELETPGAPLRIAAQFGIDAGATKLAEMSDEQFRKDVENLDAMYDQFALAISPRTTEEEAAKIQQRVQSGEFGTLGAIMMPGVDALRGSERRYKAELQQAIATIQQSAPK